MPVTALRRNHAGSQPLIYWLRPSGVCPLSLAAAQKACALKCGTWHLHVTHDTPNNVSSGGSKALNLFTYVIQTRRLAKRLAPPLIADKTFPIAPISQGRLPGRKRASAGWPGLGALPGRETVAAEWPGFEHAALGANACPRLRATRRRSRRPGRATRVDPSRVRIRATGSPET